MVFADDVPLQEKSANDLPTELGELLRLVGEEGAGADCDPQRRP